MNAEKFNNNQLYGLLPSDAEGMKTLTELSLNMRWSWNHVADELWQQLDYDLWKITHNPWIILQSVSRDKLEKLLNDKDFRNKMNDLVKIKDYSNTTPAWFQQNHSNSALKCIAYFSMEYMLSEALPIYVGGLGNVAGDQLKSASDLGVPVVAVGLLYQQGYFRQKIDKEGNQQAMFPFTDPGQLPITPLRLPNGEWLRLKINLAGHTVWLRTWEVQVGRIKLYLLDSNDVVNLPEYREITSEIYGGGVEMRIKQEILLGIGGWKLLQALDIHPEVCHMNEGHAAFLTLERACSFMKENKIPFEAALAVTRAGNLFTTHTAVAAGFDHFSPSLMWKFFGNYAKNELGIEFDNMMALGRANPFDTSEYFNMAYLAIRGSGAVNGVSHLHGKVSKSLFNILFPRQPISEIPIGSVTNGVHMPSWDSSFADKVWTDACGKNRWKGGLETLEEDIHKIKDETLWQMRNDGRNELVNFIRDRFEAQSDVADQSPEFIENAKHVFNPNTLTLGFARRFVPYKRPDLLLHDEERFVRILTNNEHPVQLVIAGKASPFDESGKALIRTWIQFIQKYNLYNHIVLLSDYDVLLTRHLVQGADVWVNTPRRPWEASGTSGMKVLVNGGINLSELDGWWAEAYTPEVGWALGDGKEHGEDLAWDAKEAEDLYDLLENQIIPDFYNRNEKDIPEKWINKMRKSMAILTPSFSANRAVREYTENYYLPAADNYNKRAAEKGAAGMKIMNTHQELLQKWNQIQFSEVHTEDKDNGHLFQVQVKLNGLNPEFVSVELYANGINSDAPVKIKMDHVSGVNDQYEYVANTDGSRPVSDYTARVIPNYENVSVPLEDNLILWQH
ncbi:glycosyltransferase family 1 protein [Kaistella flava (ex Peng et al. 2021)]|uniref:Glycosyltransferase family 1 protein n=2 Tax=Kaistella flava (ex Peng et al. 2021) TaxID=2038776 RepID=A0A7M2YDV9_9FLAO|nr:glycosyltransferase family 1 protein [Kaistella flava (ex Peng et al. 2021)]